MRDFFAAAALTGYIAHYGLVESRDNIARDCYATADRMCDHFHGGINYAHTHSPP